MKARFLVYLSFESQQINKHIRGGTKLIMYHKGNYVSHCNVSNWYIPYNQYYKFFNATAF